MNQMKEEKKEVLDYVNAIRAEFMAPPLTELPKGYMGSPDGCVIARAISEGQVLTGVYVSSVAVTFSSDCEHFSRETPEEIIDFIYKFDRLKFPELVAA